jgi:two-component sensor histidine kinase
MFSINESPPGLTGSAQLNLDPSRLNGSHNRGRVKASRQEQADRSLGLPSMQWLLRLLPGPQSLVVRYGVTAAMVGLTFGVRLAMQDRGGPYNFILFVPAILAASLMFDRGSGFLAVVLSGALMTLIMPWGHDADVHVAALTIFVLIAIPLVFVGEGLHRALEEADKAQQAQGLLLAEMSHRVKNKFAMILSLIGLQARQSQAETRAALEAIAQRVRVIANMHDHLQMARHGNLVEMSAYLGELGRSLGDTVRELRPVTVSINSQPLELEPKMALSIGLIVNELITNAFKYAFIDDQIGHVAVQFQASGGQISLGIEDDGVGCSEHSEPGLGTRLVNLLVDQLGGTLKRENLNPGCRVSVTVPLSLVANL